MEMNNPTPINPNNGLDTSTHKIFGVPRRVIAFGFALFLMLVVLAVVYSQFVGKESMMPTDNRMMSNENKSLNQGSQGMPVTGPATPDTVTADLIDEAIADREELGEYENDEMADIEDGSNY